MGKGGPSCDKSDIGMLRFILRTLFGHDCDELALRLIERFGSFGGIFDATIEELSAVPDMTERAAAFFAFVRPAFRQALLREEKGTRLCSEAALAKYSLAYFMRKTQACDYCLFLDNKYSLIRTQRLVETDCARDIVGYACRYNAARVIWLCYKPYATRLAPSLDRLDQISDVAGALSQLGIDFTDYFEYAPLSFFSLRREASDVGAMHVLDDTPFTEVALSDCVSEYAAARRSVMRGAFHGVV